MPTAPATRRIAVAGGGTAGHILTALDVLSACRKLFGCDGIFIGSETGLESRLVPERGERLETIPARPWARQFWQGHLRAIAALLPSYLAARRILRRERISLVIGTGGYASVMPCIAGWMRGVPVVIHEANAFPGLANKLLAPLSDLICVDSPETARSFASSKNVVITGTPCNPLAAPTYAPAQPFRILVLGGSEGSPWLNQHAPELFAELQRHFTRFTVHHLTGMEDPDPTQSSYNERGITATAQGWIANMTPVYAGAAFAIACPGARTLAELSIAGIPALLSPLPNVAQDHHAANARLYAEQTGARFVPIEEWNPTELAQWLAALLSDPEKLSAMSDATRTHAHTGAAEAIAKESAKLLADA